MKYDITKTKRPKMPKLGKGLEAVNLLLSQVSKIMHEPLAPTVFPSLGAHVNGCEFMYPSGIWMEPCGLIAHLCAEYGAILGQVIIILAQKRHSRVIKYSYCAFYARCISRLR